MKKIIFILTVITATVSVALISCTDSSAKGENTVIISQDSMIRRGSYLVNSIGCDDCHSPKRMGPNGPEVIEELRLAGYRSVNKLPPLDTTEIKKGWVLFAPDFTSAVGEWGASFAANLTSDATGIGNWQEAQFIKAIREGKLKGMDGTRPLLPPMPWQNFRNLTDDDLRSIFAFLKTTKPVENVVPTPKTLAQLMK